MDTVDLVTDIEWDLEPGAEFRRKELRHRFGGNQQAGIAPLKTSPNVLVFTNPAKTSLAMCHGMTASVKTRHRRSCSVEIST